MKQGLKREDLFIVGIEVAMTDTMAYADVVLPACHALRTTRMFTQLTGSSICSVPSRS